MMRAKRAPLKQLQYLPFSPLLWSHATAGGGVIEGGQKLLPYLLHRDQIGADPDSFAFGDVTSRVAWFSKERHDGADGGRHYFLRVSQTPTSLRVVGSDAIVMRSLIPHSRHFHKKYWWSQKRIKDATGYVDDVIEFHLPSVTTILDQVIDQQADLEAWRDSIGHAKADEIAAASAEKGSHVHDICEFYTTKASLPPHDQYTEEEWTLFHMLRQHIDTFDIVKASELTVFNTVLGYSGTIDMLVEVDGKYWLIDFKTYRKQRKPEHLEKARMQVALYARALSECYGIPIEKAQIIYANPESGLQVVDFDVVALYDLAEETVRKYYALRS